MNRCKRCKCVMAAPYIPEANEYCVPCSEYEDSVLEWIEHAEKERSRLDPRFQFDISSHSC